MFTRRMQLVATVGVLASFVGASLATENQKLTFSKPTNTSDSNVTVYINPGKDVSVTIPPDTSATEKRNLIKQALEDAGYDVTTEDAGGNELPGNQLRILFLRNNTEVKFDAGGTGELKDDVVAAAAELGSIGFSGVFEPFDALGAPAIFTAGIITDLGELTVNVTAEELGFVTDGPIICQALFMRLAPLAPPLGANVLLAGDRLDVYFDPVFASVGGGVSGGTTSLSEGCDVSLISAGNSCPEDLDDDGVVGLSDLAELLSAYGNSEADPGYVQRADLDGDGTIGLSDLAALLAAYGSICT